MCDLERAHSPLWSLNFPRKLTFKHKKREQTFKYYALEDICTAVNEIDLRTATTGRTVSCLWHFYKKESWNIPSLRGGRKAFASRRRMGGTFWFSSSPKGGIILKSR